MNPEGTGDIVSNLLNMYEATPQHVIDEIPLLRGRAIDLSDIPEQDIDESWTVSATGKPAQFASPRPAAPKRT